MTIFCLVRHGCTEYNVQNRLQGWLDIPLNEEGRKQVYSLINSINGRHWDIIVSSDLLRARETAETIGENLNIPVFLHDGLRERYWGKYEGRLINEIKKTTSQSNELNSEIESEEHFSERIKRTFYLFTDIFMERKIIVVSHEGVLKKFYKLFVNTGQKIFNNSFFAEVSYCRGNWEEFK